MPDICRFHRLKRNPSEIQSRTCLTCGLYIWQPKTTHTNTQSYNYCDLKGKKSLKEIDSKVKFKAFTSSLLLFQTSRSPVIISIPTNYGLKFVTSDSLIWSTLVFPLQASIQPASCILCFIKSSFSYPSFLLSLPPSLPPCLSPLSRCWRAPRGIMVAFLRNQREQTGFFRD